MLVIIFIMSKSANAQIVLPTMQPNSFVPVKLEIKSITEITNSSAKAYIGISASTNGKSDVGICWRRNPNSLPTTTDEVDYYTGSSLSFSVDLNSGMGRNKVYYARAFVIINGITTYGNLVDFLTTSGASTVANDSLNYVTMATPGGNYSDNENEFDQQTQPGYGNIISSGVAKISTVIDYSNKSTLNNAGISVTSNGDNFSLIATGYFIPTETGNYTFTCEGDDAVDLFINNQSVVGNYGPHSLANLGSHTGIISLTAGTKYSVRARMQDYAGQEALRVLWRKPSQTTGWFQSTGEMSSF